ncbi:MAG: DUF1850 domain-containing protein [Desulfobacterales bacterium]|nr:DUF1850 domain-containing protein [Desulfobacterales bacterium]
MTRPSLILILLCLAGLLTAALQGIYFTALTIRLPDQNDKIAFMVPMETGERFTLAYRHSVEKTAVQGIFQLSEEPGILAVETRMTSVGTGLPNTFSKRTRREGKWMVVDEGMAEIPPFRFFIATVNQSRIHTPHRELDLMALPQGTIIVVGVEQLPLYFLYKSLL